MNHLAGSLKLNCQPENVNCHSLNPQAKLPKVPTNSDEKFEKNIIVILSAVL